MSIHCQKYLTDAAIAVNNIFINEAKVIFCIETCDIANPDLIQIGYIKCSIKSMHTKLTMQLFKGL